LFANSLQEQGQQGITGDHRAATGRVSRKNARLLDGQASIGPAPRRSTFCPLSSSEGHFRHHADDGRTIGEEVASS